MIKHGILCSICVVMLSACTIGPNFEKPLFGLEESSWINGGNTDENYVTKAAVEEEWWGSLNDPVLSALIDQAVQTNIDLKIAQANLERADALLSQARSGLFPGVDAEGAITRRQLSEGSGIPTGPFNPRIQNFYDVDLLANWELDIFGGTRREIAAAYARYESLEEQKRDTLLMILSEVARNYIEMRGAQQRERIILNNIALQEKTAALVKRRFDAGEANEFDYGRAQAQLQSTKARLPNIDGQIDTLIYRLSVLAGQPPEALLAELSPPKALPVNPDIVRVGLRSDLLRRRPDIRAAERNLEAEVNDIGAATAELFPQFTLTGGWGFESIGSDDFISSSSETWQIGPGLRWPIFSAGRIRAQINAEEADAERAALEYEQTILLALEDAEAAFVQYGRELETRTQLKETVQIRMRNVELARKRYDKGLDSLIALIDTERELLASEEELIASETELLLKLVRLYKSLGGSWQVFEVKQ